MPTSRKRPEPERVHPLTLAEWRTWLACQHAREAGVWLVSYKKGVGKPRVEYEEAVVEAIAWGWIDSKPAKLDSERSMLWFAPRKPGTGWSQINKARVAKALAEGRMQRAGLAKVEAAKRDGSWARLDAVEALALPDDLVTALAGYAEARGFWDRFPRSAKRGMLEWIQNAKRPETRAKRIAETARLAASNLRANQWRGSAPQGVDESEGSERQRRPARRAS